MECVQWDFDLGVIVLVVDLASQPA